MAELWSIEEEIYEEGFHLICGVMKQGAGLWPARCVQPPVFCHAG